MKVLLITILMILISGCGEKGKNSIKYPETENKPSESQDANWGKGAWDNLNWK